MCCVFFVRFCLIVWGGFCYIEKDVIDLNIGKIMILFLMIFLIFWVYFVFCVYEFIY